MKTTELSAYLDDFLMVPAYVDYAPNGLQIEGKSEIRRICTAVTASLDAIQQAVDVQADALLVHHGFFWKGEALSLLGMKKRRIQLLLKRDLNLFAYHLPLDCHLELGNNALMARHFDLQGVKQHTVSQIKDILWSGELVSPFSFESFHQHLGKVFNQAIQAVQAPTKSSIKRIAWCTGAAQDFIEQAAQLGVDAYLSGEISERTYYQARELGVHFFACGHHATERAGIAALGEHLAKRFHLTHEFIDSENPV